MLHRSPQQYFSIRRFLLFVTQNYVVVLQYFDKMILFLSQQSQVLLWEMEIVTFYEQFLLY